MLERAVLTAGVADAIECDRCSQSVSPTQSVLRDASTRLCWRCYANESLGPASEWDDDESEEDDDDDVDDDLEEESEWEEVDDDDDGWVDDDDDDEEDDDDWGDEEEDEDWD